MLLTGGAVARAEFSVGRAAKQTGGQKFTLGAMSSRSSHPQGVVLSSQFGLEQQLHKRRVVVASAASASVQSNNSQQGNVKEASATPATILEVWEGFQNAGKDDEFPAQYIEREQDRPRLRYDEYNKEGATIPVLNFALVKSDRAALVKGLADACKEWGFFHLMNHGIPQEVLNDVEAQGFRFFRLPTERKKASGRSRTGEIYIGNCLSEPKTSLQWAECLRLSGPATNGVDEWCSRVWPDSDRAFRDVAVKYAAMVDGIFKTLLELLAEGLGLKTNYFTQFVTEKRMVGQIWNYYPPCPLPGKILGSRPHTDGCSMTILRTSEVGGLQLQKDGEWVAVLPISGGLVVNMGDVLQAWTNGIYKSVLHRVVANPTAERLSVASFCNVDTDHLISAPDELVDDEHPRLYRPYKFMEYALHVVNTRMKDPYAERDGRVVLEGFRLGGDKE